jgi:hypothetical protein
VSVTLPEHCYMSLRLAKNKIPPLLTMAGIDPMTSLIAKNDSHAYI